MAGKLLRIGPLQGGNPGAFASAHQPAALEYYQTLLESDQKRKRKERKL